MPNHQQRRDPLPADYQYPTHGVVSRADIVCGMEGIKATHYGDRKLTPVMWRNGAWRLDVSPTLARVDIAVDFPLVTYGTSPDAHACPKCSGPSYRGGVCFNCTAEPS